MLDLLQLVDESLAQAAGNPVRMPGAEPSLDPHAAFRMKVVQIGIWEAQRRLVAGETDGLNMVLANLEEDIQLLRRSLEETHAVCEA